MNYSYSNAHKKFRFYSIFKWYTMHCFNKIIKKHSTNIETIIAIIRIPRTWSVASLWLAYYVQKAPRSYERIPYTSLHILRPSDSISWLLNIDTTVSEYDRHVTHDNASTP